MQPYASNVAAAPEGEAAAELGLSRGTSLGRYVVLEPLGRGGSGIVYRAFDPELDRHVALKLLRRASGVALDREQERLLGEGKALARLSHPNIVSVFDVGTHEGRIFVAMELVEGQTLRGWLLTRRSWREVLRVFLQAAHGLAAAHAAGIVHRDFKPDNALIGKDGRVRVVDFGLAWTPASVNAVPATSGSFESASGISDGPLGSIVGTPRYCPTEQIEGRRVDARADQFAFCASLWEAWHGRLPFGGGDLFTLLRQMREGAVVRGRPMRGVPGPMLHALRRGLSGDPQQRFASMTALLEVLERDPTRRRWIVASAFAGTALAVCGALAGRARAPQAVCGGGERKLLGAWDPERRATVAGALAASGKDWAPATADIVSAELDRYGAAWTAMHREACEATSVRHEQSEALLDLRMQCLNDRLGELRALTALLSQPADGLLASAPKAAYGLTPLAGCADARALRAPVPLPDDAAVRAAADEVHAGLARARALNELGRFADADPLTADLADRATSLRYAPIEAEALEVRADTLEYLADYGRAAEAYRRALWAAERGQDRSRAASVMINLVWLIGMDQGQHAPALDYASHAEAVLVGLGGNPQLEANLASHWGGILCNGGQYDEGTRRSREAVDKRKSVFGTMHPRYAMALMNTARCLADAGHYAEALDLSRQGLAVNAATLGEHHPDYALSLQGVAATLKLNGHPDEARVLGERAVQVLKDSLGADHTRVASAEWSLALTEMALGDPAAAEPLLRHALAVTEARRGSKSYDAAEYACSLADDLVALGRHGEALALYRQALAILAKEPNADQLAEVQTGIGVCLQMLGRPSEGLAGLEEALAWREHNDVGPRSVAETQLAVSRALWAIGRDRDRARRLAEQAVHTCAGVPEADRVARDAAAWLEVVRGGRRP